MAECTVEVYAKQQISKREKVVAPAILDRSREDMSGLYQNIEMGYRRKLNCSQEARKQTRPRMEGVGRERV